MFPDRPALRLELLDLLALIRPLLDLPELQALLARLAPPAQAILVQQETQVPQERRV